MTVRALTNTHTNTHTDGQTDGRYQVHYLPCFAVDKYSLCSVMITLNLAIGDHPNGLFSECCGMCITRLVIDGVGHL